MIKVKVKGGLGNQLFQYAFARAIGLHYGQNVFLDLSSYTYDKKRSYSLNNFLLNENIKPIKDQFFINFLSKYIPYSWRMYKRHVEKKDFHFDHEVLTIAEKSIQFEGYWQSEKYFYGLRSILKKEIVLKHQISEKKIMLLNAVQSGQTVSIHIRRGDYLFAKESEIHATLSLDYYYKAINFIKSKVKDPLFFVFSDDIEFARNNLEIENAHYIKPDGKDYEDLMIMSLCAHNIIANSSFSWWAAWLNSNNNKIIVAPNMWLKNQSDTKDLIPENWIRI